MKKVRALVTEEVLVPLNCNGTEEYLDTIDRYGNLIRELNQLYVYKDVHYSDKVFIDFDCKFHEPDDMLAQIFGDDELSAYFGKNYYTLDILFKGNIKGCIDYVKKNNLPLYNQFTYVYVEKPTVNKDKNNKTDFTLKAGKKYIPIHGNLGDGYIPADAKMDGNTVTIYMKDGTKKRIINDAFLQGNWAAGKVWIEYCTSKKAEEELYESANRSPYNLGLHHHGTIKECVETLVESGMLRLVYIQ